MAGLRDLLQKENRNGSHARKAVEALQKEYPLVAELLGGLEAKDGQPEVSPGTITIFVHEGKARFSINVKSAEKTFIGDLADVVNPWGSINSALMMGDVSSKRYTDRTPSYTDEQKSRIL